MKNITKERVSPGRYEILNKGRETGIQVYKSEYGFSFEGLIWERDPSRRYQKKEINADYKLLKDAMEDFRQNIELRVFRLIDSEEEMIRDRAFRYGNI